MLSSCPDLATYSVTLGKVCASVLKIYRMGIILLTLLAGMIIELNHAKCLEKFLLTIVILMVVRPYIIYKGFEQNSDMLFLRF